MTSSCLCKNAEGAGFPFQVEALEDGVDEAVRARDVHKVDHRPGTATHFHEAALNDVGGTQLLPQMPRKAEERQQLRQIALQLPHHGAVHRLPTAAECAKSSLGLPTAVGAINRSVMENVDETAAGKLMRNIYGAFNQLDNGRKAVRTELGMQKAASEGEFPFKAPPADG